MLEIRRAVETDFDQIWEIFHPVAKRADTYMYAPDISKDDARRIWISKDMATYVACDEAEIVGTYILRPNQPVLGAHVANAGYMVKRKGIGRAMCEHSLQEARHAGFLAMQFNAVVSTNENAVALWKKMGFSIVGTVPKAFQHKELGLVDIFIMHRFLD